MGVYAYSLRAKTRNVIIDGEAKTVHQLDYLFKPFRPNGFDICNLQKLMLGNAERYWEDRGMPEFVVFANDGKVEEGATIFKWGSKDPIWWDCDKIPGEELGTITKKGRRWHLKPSQTPQPSTV